MRSIIRTLAFLPALPASLPAPLSSSSPSPAQHPHPSPSPGPSQECGRAGTFDFYIFARFYDRSQQPCGTWGAENLTIHGLWPSYYKPQTDNCPKGVEWPQFCGKQRPAEEWKTISTVQDAVSSEFASDWKTLAPSYLGSLAQHEWEKHGVCSAATLRSMSTEEAVRPVQEKFFRESLDLMRQFPMPSAIRDARDAGKALGLAELHSAFGDKRVALSCSYDHSTKKAYLSMVELCFEGPMDAGGAVGAHIDCPDIVLHSRYDDGCDVYKDTSVYVDQQCKSPSLVI